MLCGNASVMGMQGYKDRANGSAVMSFVSIGVCALISYATNFKEHHSAIFMPIVFLCSLVASGLVLIKAYKNFADISVKKKSQNNKS